MRVRMLRRGGLVGLAAAAALIAGTAPASAVPGDGSAYALKVNVSLLGKPAVHVGPLSVANTNGPAESTFAGVDLPGIAKVGVLKASAHRDDTTGEVHSSASTADVSLPLLSGLGHTPTIKVITATCRATQKGVTGNSELVDADLGSLGKIPLHPMPNTTIDVSLPGLGNVATVIFNEQIRNGDGSMTVNGLHIKLLSSGTLAKLGSGDVVISSATCGPAALPVPMASGAGLWIGFGLLGAVAIPVGVRYAIRRRSGSTASV